jgi:5-methylcytosine-specific restriction protein A
MVLSMPTLPLRPCTHVGCSKLVPRGRCQEHQRQVVPLPERGRPYDDRRGSSTQRGYGYAWQQRRQAWLKRFPCCVVCGKPAKIVDHRIPKSQGGADDETNYQGLCILHNNQKTGRERRQENRHG